MYCPSLLILTKKVVLSLSYKTGRSWGAAFFETSTNTLFLHDDVEENQFDFEILKSLIFQTKPISTIYIYIPNIQSKYSIQIFK